MNRLDDTAGPGRSAIVEPKRRPKNAGLTHSLDEHDGSKAAQRRRGELATELFRDVVRRAARKE